MRSIRFRTRVVLSAASKARAGSTGCGTSRPHAPNRLVARETSRTVTTTCDRALRRRTSSRLPQRSRCGPSALMPGLAPRSEQRLRRSPFPPRARASPCGGCDGCRARSALASRAQPSGRPLPAGTLAESGSRSTREPRSKGRKYAHPTRHSCAPEVAHERPSMYPIAARRLGGPCPAGRERCPFRPLPGPRQARDGVGSVSWAFRAAAPPTARERRGGRRDALLPGPRPPANDVLAARESRRDIAPARLHSQERRQRCRCARGIGEGRWLAKAGETYMSLEPGGVSRLSSSRDRAH